MSHLTLPTVSQNFIITGDFDLRTGLDADQGTGTMYVRNGGIYVSGLTDLAETTVSTTSGPFTVNGTGASTINVGGLVSITSTNAGESSFKSTLGSLLFETQAVTGTLTVESAATGDSALFLHATAGQLQLQSDSTSGAQVSVNLYASDTTNGIISLTGAGSGNGVQVYATNTTSGKIRIESFGQDNNAVGVYAPSGGVEITGTKKILVSTTDTTNGVHIATATAGVPVRVGTASSLTTIAGDLTVMGTTTTLNTVSLTVEDNLLILNSGLATLGADGGVAVRRYQTANNATTGDVITTPNPIQESGEFQAGSATPGTLVLALHSSISNDFYKGWWINISSGPAAGQIRRIKSYIGSTKVATLYVTADNSTVPGSLFSDGLDLVTAPSVTNTYKLFSGPYVGSYYDETTFKWNIGTTPTADSLGISSETISQPQAISTGAHDIFSQTYKNLKSTAALKVITFTLTGHGLLVGDKVDLSAPRNFTPLMTAMIYDVVTVPTVDTFTILVAADTTATTSAAANIRILKSSIIRVNVIEALDPSVGISIDGVSQVEYIEILKTESGPYHEIAGSSTLGSYIVMIADFDDPTGACATFAFSSSGTGGSKSRMSSSRGADGQRLDATWGSGEKIKIQHSSAGSGAGNYKYVVRYSSAI